MIDKHLEEKLFHTAAGPEWKKISVRHHHGICLPLFSLHSEKSSGIGEYLDLIPLISWCREVGLDLIQFLPLNDTGLETSPYSALSAFALNPLYLSISALPQVELVPDYEEKISKMRYWNETTRVKYHIIRELKKSFLQEYVPLLFETLSNTDSYRTFLAQNKSWLQPYALFKALKENQFWRNWEEWPLRLKNPSTSTYEELIQEHLPAYQYHEFLQFLCFHQWQEVRRVAQSKGILLKGDIPILVNRESADVWYHQSSFFLHYSAGAPPDMYSKEGQEWGFPVYNWEEQEKNGYDWWVKRLQVASQLFDVYRLDHIVGFFRIWAIARDASAKKGHFVPHDPVEWMAQGEKLMKMMLNAAPMLPIGEDLGLVPKEVKQCLTNLGICGTRVMRWERSWEGDKKFIPLDSYSSLSMTTVSTHDSDTLQLWWRHYPQEARIFSQFLGWHYEPFLSPERQKEILKLSHHTSSLFHINLLQEYLALFPDLVSKHPTQERINVPGTILESNWTYRFRPTVEEIVAHPHLKQAFLDILK